MSVVLSSNSSQAKLEGAYDRLVTLQHAMRVVHVQRPSLGHDMKQLRQITSSPYPARPIKFSYSGPIIKSYASSCHSGCKHMPKVMNLQPRPALSTRDCYRRAAPACRRPDLTSGPVFPGLTSREKQIIGLVSQGKLNKEIAHQLHLSEGTVKQYLFAIFRKLAVTNRTELAVWSLAHPAECRP
jgi:DNA-binding CsgD family transcriptional regulator